MTVHIQRAVSDVEVQPEASAPLLRQQEPGDEVERLRELRERMERDARRTAARGYDD